ncbi:hypothetical protein NJF54_19935 [Pseudomonas guariconensis]|uniref:hypothetical protein n=1 Tax=Pseudomonas guariconensis TaxID=1288410 RepID=UPI00209AD87D|nr:hypothetical protein [Pseudomonas guariconensis]MCO7634095.1 hypothetical protein [Pseudomonas guariconensis]
MSKYTEAIVQAAQGLEKAEAAHKVAAERLAAVRNHCGQRGYSVTVNGVTVAVSECDSRTYQGTLIRGREMIHLGALKALGAELDAAEKRVLEWRAYLASIVIK